MPFQSEKQRRYLHANHPEIAKRWERDYANGGILDINESEEIIDDDGNEIELTDYNAAFDEPNGVKSLFRAKDGGRIGFFTGMREQEQRQQERQTRGPRDDPDRHGPVQTVTPTPTRDDKRPLTGPQEGWTEEEVKTAVAEGERKAELKRLALQTQREKTEEWEKTQDWKPPESGVKKFFKTVALTLIPGLLPAELGKFWTAGTKIANYRAGEYDKYLIGPASKFRSDGEYAKEVEKAIKEHVEKMKLINSLPKGHPERILLEESLDYGPYKTTGDQDDGDEGPIVDPVTLEVDEEYAQGEDGYPGFAFADMRAKQALNAQLQQKWAAEQEAYDQLYLGANSGGLANLFRVKN